MAGFSSYDNLITQITTNGQLTDAVMVKTSTALFGSAASPGGQWHRLYTALGFPKAGADPVGSVSYTSDASSMTFPNVSTKTRWLLKMGGSFTAQNNDPGAGATPQAFTALMLHDRLSATGNVSLTTTGNKTVNTAALPRYTSGVNVQAWLEVSTAPSVTAPIVNLSAYTNDAGVAGHSGGNYNFPSVGGTFNVFDDAVGPLPIQAGDKGIRSIQVGLNVGTASSTGAVTVTLLRPLLIVPFTAAQWNEKDSVLQLTALTQIFDGASLGLYMLSCGGTSAQQTTTTVRTGFG